MSSPTLLEDLINNFQEEKESLHKEIELADPLAAAIRKPAASHFFQNSFLAIVTFACWVFLIGCVAVLFFMDKIYPFYLLSELRHNSELLQNYAPQDLDMLAWGVKGLIVIIALLLFFIARMCTRLRKKNSILRLGSRNLKLLMEQYFKRRTSLAQLENKYPIELPVSPDGIAPPPPTLSGDEDIPL